MRKLKFLIAAAVLCICLAVGNISFLLASATEERYYVGGMTAGFLLNAGGAQVIGLNDVVAEDGVYRPAEAAGICAGDLICAVNSLKIQSCEELNFALEKGKGNKAALTVKRNGEEEQVELTPVKEKKSGKYKIGVLIRDTLSGIGTVTYVAQDSLRFGALGHAVCDEQKEGLSISDARVYSCSVIGVNRGGRGKAGELRGLFLNDKRIAKAEKVCSEGLYGTYLRSPTVESRPLLPVGAISEATIGKAEIYSTVDGVTPQKYEIAIAKVDAAQRENKNFVVKVTDERLIALTGGIVQGMSGSPIVQNGKLIGAITHVFLNDPTRGYGISIEKMICN